jgi:hypothetical protein
MLSCQCLYDPGGTNRLDMSNFDGKSSVGNGKLGSSMSGTLVSSTIVTTQRANQLTSN